MELVGEEIVQRTLHRDLNKVRADIEVAKVGYGHYVARLCRGDNYLRGDTEANAAALLAVQEYGTDAGVRPLGDGMYKVTFGKG